MIDYKSASNNTSNAVDADSEDYLDSIGNYTIHVSPNDFNTMTLVEQIKRGNIIIPNFQRNYVWTQKQASGLIESILIGLPIPQIFIFEDKKMGTNKYQVIDGQQRLLSIYFFVNGRFPKVNRRDRGVNSKSIISNINLLDDNFIDFRLKLPSAHNEQSKYNKKTYDDIKDDFDMKTIRTIIVRQDEPKGDAAMYEIFRRLNTGGENLKPQEIRRCVYHSKFYDMLDGINDIQGWRRLIGKGIKRDRFADIEILLRSFAMLVKGDSYRPSLVKFLNDFSDEAREFDDDKIKQLKLLFKSFITNNTNLQTKHFHNQNKNFSAPMFESVFAATCASVYSKKLTNAPVIDIKLLENLKNNFDFKAASERQTTSKANVTKRLELARSILTTNGD